VSSNFTEVLFVLCISLLRCDSVRLCNETLQQGVENKAKGHRKTVSSKHSTCNACWVQID